MGKCGDLELGPVTPPPLRAGSSATRGAPRGGEGRRNELRDYLEIGSMDTAQCHGTFT
jgi:hypothetical protein